MKRQPWFVVVVGLAVLVASALSGCTKNEPPDSCAFFTCTPATPATIGYDVVATGDGPVNVRVLEKSGFDHTLYLNNQAFASSGEQGRIVEIGEFANGAPLSFSIDETFFSGAPPTRNPDHHFHSASIQQNWFGGTIVVLGFEDINGLGDADFNDARLSISNARLIQHGGRFRVGKDAADAWINVTTVKASLGGGVSVWSSAGGAACDPCAAGTGKVNVASAGISPPIGTQIHLLLRMPDGRVVDSTQPQFASVQQVSEGLEARVRWDLDGDGLFGDVVTSVWARVYADGESGTARWGEGDPQTPDDYEEPGNGFFCGAWDRLNLTYASSGTPVGITPTQRAITVRAAFNEVDRKSAFTFTPASSWNSADIRVRITTSGFSGITSGLGESDWTERIEGGPTECRNRIQKPVTITINAYKLYSAGTQPFPQGFVLGDGVEHPSAPVIDLQSVVLHEAIHSLGAVHSRDTNAVIYWLYNGSKRVLTAEDTSRLVVNCARSPSAVRLGLRLTTYRRACLPTS